AQLLPSANPQDPPLVEVALRHSSRLGRKIQQLPQWWSEDLTSPVAAPTTLTADGAPVPSPAPAAPALDPAQQEAIESELSALETELGALDNRLADLEVKLNQPVSDAPLEIRVRQLSRSLSPEAPAAPANASPAPSAPAAAAPAAADPNPLFQLARDRVTLPSALLFSPQQAILTPNAERLLDTLISDLARYPGATLVVGSYSDGQSPDADRDLSFRQALAVQQYLASRLGDGYRWVPVGYGQSRPLVSGSSEADRLRNQRIEIAIVPPR
ncbi:MAG TPA: OmpA family protein, partial [Trichocoleus sp.]